MNIALVLMEKCQNDLALLKEDYRSKLAHGRWIVEFQKVDGTRTAMECTLDAKLLPPQKEVTVARPEKEDILHVYSPDREGWRSFKVLNVTAFYQKPEAL